MIDQSKIRNFCIIAHIDHGKSTLADRIIEMTGTLTEREMQSQVLDNMELERERGITIKSQAVRIVYKAKDGEEYIFNLIDTPGHVDFSAEMERTLQVLDAAILVIDGSDGVQGDVYTLWRLLKRYEVPVFLFVNKMDQEGTDGEKLLKELRKRFGENVVPFVDIMTESDCPGGKVYLHTKEGAVEEVLEELAVCEDDMMEELSLIHI